MGKNGAMSTQQIIKMASEIASTKVLESLEKERSKYRKGLYDRRLRNTKLLLKNYRTFLSHCTSAIYDKQQSALEILDSADDCLYNEKLYVDSIKRSVDRTAIILSHIEKMVRVYEILCNESKSPEDIRRYRVIHGFYISDDPKSIEDLAEEENVQIRTVYRDIDAACDTLTGLFFGIDGINMAL